jgi:periplasmic divalent cation tolerance protein
MNLPLLITTTFENHADAEKMATMLLEKRLVACAQISGPVRSMYWWQGKIVSSDEYLLTMKSIGSLYSDLEQLILASHPYETPEIIAIVMSHVSKDYQQWLEKELRP